MFSENFSTISCTLHLMEMLAVFSRSFYKSLFKHPLNIQNIMNKFLNFDIKIKIIFHEAFSSDETTVLKMYKEPKNLHENDLCWKWRERKFIFLVSQQPMGVIGGKPPKPKLTFTNFIIVCLRSVLSVVILEEDAIPYAWMTNISVSRPE